MNCDFLAEIASMSHAAFSKASVSAKAASKDLAEEEAYSLSSDTEVEEKWKASLEVRHDSIQDS